MRRLLMMRRMRRRPSYRKHYPTFQNHLCKKFKITYAITYRSDHGVHIVFQVVEQHYHI